MLETKLAPVMDSVIPFLEGVRTYVRTELLTETDDLLQQLRQIRTGEQRPTLRQCVELLHHVSRLWNVSRPREVGEELAMQGQTDPFHLLDALILLQSIYASEVVAQPVADEPPAPPLEPPVALEEEIVRWLDAQKGFTGFSTPSGWIIASCPDHPEHPQMTACLQRLYARFGADLGKLAADLYFAPQRWLPHYYEHPEYSVHMATILNACIVPYAPPNILERIEARITDIRRYMADPLHYSGERAEISKFSLEPPHVWVSDELMHLINSLCYSSPFSGRLQQFRHLRIWPAWMPGSLQACLNVLLALPLTPQSCALAMKLQREDYWERDVVYGGSRHHTLSRLVESSIKDTLVLLFRYGSLSYAVYQHCALLIPRELLNNCQAMARQVPEQQRDGFLQQMEHLLRRFILDIASDLTPANCYAIRAIAAETPLPLPGSDCLLLAAQAHAKLNAGPLVLEYLESYKDTVQKAIIRLVQAHDSEPTTSAQRQRLLDGLRQYPAETLKRLLPVVSANHDVLCEALNWTSVYPLLDYLKKQAGQLSPQHEDRAEADGSDLPGVDSAVLNVAEVRTLLAQIDPDNGREALDLFYEANSMRDTCTLLAAVAGWNRARVEKSLKHNALTAIKAYGLLPLERGQEELFEHYLVLQQKLKLAPKFGPQRRVSHKEAVQTALRYQARVAGYPDASLLELEMEARLSQEIAPPGRTWSAGDYTLELHITGLEVSLLIQRDGHRLKSVPPAVRKDPAYSEAQTVVKMLRAQVSRLRSELLETLIASGEALSLEHLKMLAHLTTGRALLERLILRTADGHIGLFEAGAFAVRHLDGSLHPVTSAVQIAHPYTLFEAGILAAWQREIVRLRVVQPIKQAFRELYLLTPAEETTCTYSLRFAGRSIEGRVAGRLFTQRQWRFESDYQFVIPYKIFPNMRAVFNLTGTMYHLGISGTVTTSDISFERAPWYGNANRPPGERTIPLAEVPPLNFSEAMRDADLVVSVARTQQADRPSYSNETYTARAGLLTALLADLNLTGVTLEGHFAYVQGKLARYRVHLGTAGIYIDPGTYLCIVPAAWGKTHENLFLPYADEGDDSISEVISKIFLLLADDQIKDETILRQIRAHIL
ncbi:MAG: DUF4132 domain-containing protein [Chloroflexota bacterium]|nr:DUF4132 domain-containing protein [Chloroflexota bacterium]